MQTSLERQRQTVAAATAAAVQQQRLAIRRQLQAPEDGQSGFFVLPALSHRPLLARSAPAAQCEPMPKEAIEPLLQDAARREGLSADLLRAVATQESGLRPCAVSPKGAMGLMQLMPATASYFGVTDPFDPRQNIDSGARFLKQLLTRYGDNVALALGAYNSGPGRVDLAGGLPDIAETLQYVQAIIGGLPAR